MVSARACPRSSRRPRHARPVGSAQFPASQPPAEPDLEHRRLRPRPLEHGKRGERSELEVRERRGAARGLDGAYVACEVDDVEAAVRERLLPAERPKDYVLVVPWPRNAQGKVDLAAMLGELARRLGRRYADFADLVEAAPEARYEAGNAAPAASVACLALMD